MSGAILATIETSIGRASMVFSDGECPACGAAQLHLNTSDLFECPQCHLVCACIDGILATVMPFRGRGNFRFEDCAVAPFRGVAFARSASGGVEPDVSTIFKSQSEIAAYVAQVASDDAPAPKGEALSASFLSEFRNFILGCTVQELSLAWSTNTNRTSFYKQTVMPIIARRLGLRPASEEFKVDYVMATISSRGHAIPKIYIESENDYASAEHEVRKLCSINSPLRVLITQTKKSFIADFSSPAHKGLREWQSIVRSHHEESPDFMGVICVIVGRTVGNDLEFLACAFKSTGDLLRPLSQLLRRDMA